MAQSPATKDEHAGLLSPKATAQEQNEAEEERERDSVAAVSVESLARRF